MTIENEEQYLEAVARLRELTDSLGFERDEATFLDLTAAMVAYETRFAKPVEE